MSATYEPATYRIPAVSADPTEIRAWSAERPVADPPADPLYRVDYAELPPDPCVPSTTSSAGKAAFVGAAVVLGAVGAQALLGSLYDNSATSPPGPAIGVPANAGPAAVPPAVDPPPPSAANPARGPVDSGSAANSGSPVSGGVPANGGPEPVSTVSLPDSGPGRADAGPPPDNGGAPTDAGNPPGAPGGLVIGIPVLPPVISQSPKLDTKHETTSSLDPNVLQQNPPSPKHDSTPQLNPQILQQNP